MPYLGHVHHELVTTQERSKPVVDRSVGVWQSERHLVPQHDEDQHRPVRVVADHADEPLEVAHVPTVIHTSSICRRGQRRHGLHLY